MDFATVRENLARVREHIALIQAREGLDHHVTIVGVTKGHPAEALRAASQGGLRDIGENRVQEALKKLEQVGHQSLRWHLIGHLQTNKAKYVPGVFDLVHSVDSDKVVAALSSAWERRAAATGDRERMEILLQVNLAGEEQKTGCSPESATELAHAMVASEALRLRGVMTMAPLTGDVKIQRRVFAALREIRDTLRRDGLDVPELSMGMSADYEAAIAEGATMVRLGTVLFGERET